MKYFRDEIKKIFSGIMSIVIILLNMTYINADGLNNSYIEDNYLENINSTDIKDTDIIKNIGSTITKDVKENDIPDDWAFKESSRRLNDIIRERYDVDKDGDGYISKSEAGDFTGDIDFFSDYIGCTLDGIEYFTKVSRIEIIACDLKGNIPEGVGNLVNLIELNLKGNYMDGKIPDSICELSSLKVLDLSFSDFENIPLNIGDLTELEYLNIAGSGLKDGIPESIIKLKKLKELDLSRNRNLGGSIPIRIGDLDNLTDLVLSDSGIEGTIPFSIVDMDSIENIELSHNYLTGSIPNDIGDLSTLKYFTFNSNFISGELPNSIKNLSKLNMLDASKNNIMSIPEEVYAYLSKNIISKLEDQVGTFDIKELAILSEDYEFNGIPAYLQLDKYGSPLIYNLSKVSENDSSSIIYKPGFVDSIIGKTIDPKISRDKDGSVKVTVSGSDITEEGDYRLYVYSLVGPFSVRNGYDFGPGVLYTTKFKAIARKPVEEIDYIKAFTDGEEGKKTSEKIDIKISKEPEAGKLSVDNVSLGLKNSTGTIEKRRVSSKGNGEYEVEISGTWNEGDVVDVKLEKDKVIFKPDTLDIKLHKENKIKVEEIDYVKAFADGEEGKKTSEKIDIKISKEPEAGKLSVDNVSLSLKNSTGTIEKRRVSSKGNGEYEVEISGTWNEGDVVDVKLEKDKVIFKPYTLDIKLHKENKIKVEEIDYIKAFADGEEGKKTSEKIDIKISNEPEAGKLSVDNVSLGLKNSTGTIEKRRVSSKGNGEYKIEISGTWNEGDVVDVKLEKDKVIFKPDTLDTKLHKEKVNESRVTESTLVSNNPTMNKKVYRTFVMGYPDLTFRADKNISRGEVVTIFSNILEDYYTDEKYVNPSFNDIDSLIWYRGRIGYLEKLGMIKGYPDGSFRGEAPITRAEFVIIVANFDKLEPIKINPFNDINESYWAREYILSVANKGWVSGYPDGSFRSEQYITRAEVVTIVNNMLGIKVDKEYIDANVGTIKTYTDLSKSHWAYYNINATS
ncbi:MAG: S-layer homology domain-containing protein [Filifactoraceae bacterium]